MQLFSSGAIVKKPASKVAHNWPRPFISQSSPDHRPQPRIDFSYYEISWPEICSLICDLKLTDQSLPPKKDLLCKVEPPNSNL